ncbi:hypothetical protein QYF36_015003 [Acer negundo]|nr:hypothetical protein QYF36_015003 [Acer negundo]
MLGMDSLVMVNIHQVIVKSYPLQRLETALEDAIGSKTCRQVMIRRGAMVLKEMAMNMKLRCKNCGSKIGLLGLRGSLQDLKQQDFVINSPPLH